MYSKVDIVKHSIKLANMGYSKLTEQTMKIQGYSGHAVKHFLNNVCSYPGTNYLEVGVHQGATFIPAMFMNILDNSTAVDNWSVFGNVKDAFIDNSKRFIHTAYNFIEQDCFTLSVDQFDHKVNVFFYDGDHSYDAQYKAVTYFEPFLDDTFILVVDDFNYERVEKGTLDAINASNYNTLYKEIIKTNVEGDPLGWWNGMGIFVLEKK